MSKAQVKVKAGEKEFKAMLFEFKKQVLKNKIIQTYKKKEYYESPGKKRRRKEKEATINRLRAERKKKL